MQTLAEAAAEYARAGFRVFPLWGVRTDGSCLCPAARTCGNPGKHPQAKLAPHGLRDASDDEAMVASWWRRDPNANVAVATGAGLLVVDGDKKEGVDGIAAFLRLAEARGGMPETAVADTGGGGAHWWFAVPDGLYPRNQQALRVGDERVRGIDVRGEGGYVVVPPSVHASGGRYSWVRNPHEHLRPAPTWILELTCSSTEPERAERDVPRGTFPAGRTVEPAELARLRAALATVPADCDRETWIERVSMPVHDAFGGSEEGFELWHDWCASAEGKTTPNGHPAYRGRGECLRVWRSFSAHHRNPRGLPTLYRLARELAPDDRPATPNGHPATPISPLIGAGFDEEEVAEAMDSARDPGPFPLGVVHGLRGPIGELVRWVVDCSRRADPALAFAASLAAVAAACGRRFEGPGRTRPALALAVLAPSGAGKDRPLECLKNLLAAHPNLLVGVLDDVPTHRAQLDALLLRSRGQLLLALDEYGSALARWLRGTESAANTVSPAIRRLVGHGRTTYGLAPLSIRHPSRAEDPDAWDAGVFAPALTLIGFATPGQFYEGLSEASLIDGFLGRHLVVSSQSIYPLRVPIGETTEPPAAVSEWLAAVERLSVPRIAPSRPLEEQQGTAEALAPEDARIVPWADAEAEAAFARLAGDLDARGIAALESDFVGDSDEVRAAVLRRLPGQVAQLAVVLALGEAEEPLDARIDRRHLDAAARICGWSADHLSFRLRSGVASSDLGRAHQRIRDAIEKAAGKRVYRSRFAGKLWAGAHLYRVWPLIMDDPLFEATERWARRRTAADAG